MDADDLNILSPETLDMLMEMQWPSDAEGSELSVEQLDSLIRELAGDREDDEIEIDPPALQPEAVDNESPASQPINDPNNASNINEEPLIVDKPPSPEPVPGPSNVGSVEKFYEVIDESNRTIEKFNADCIKVLVRLIQPENITTHPEAFLKDAFTQIVEDFVNNGCGANDRIGMTIANNVENNKPIYISYRAPDQIDATVILNEFARILQSNENFFINNPIDIGITKIKMPVGGARTTKFLTLPFHEFCQKKKQSILQIKNSDSLCLPRALIMAMAHSDKDNNPEHYRKMTRTDRRKDYVEPLAKKLCEDAGVTIGEGGGGIEAINLFQEYLEDYRITVFDGTDRRGCKVIFEGDDNNADDNNPNTKKNIDLIYAENHYNVITSLAGAFTHAYYCRRCHVGYSHKIAHKCADIEKCLKCLHSPPCDAMETKISCKACNRLFYGAICYENHKQPNPNFEKNRSVCDEMKYCPYCSMQYSLSSLYGKKHLCGHHTCMNCRKQVPDGHLCYIQPVKKSSLSKLDTTAFVFFDFESRVEDQPGPNGGYKHIPNFCVVQRQCGRCIADTDIDSDCSLCARREFVIKNKEGDELLAELLTILANTGQTFKKVLAFAHNGGGYDHQFILEYLVRERSATPKIILNGSKIVQMTWENVTFKDTLNFFHARLASLPKMFGLEAKVKGHFPHRFNTLPNQNYVGELPSSDYYSPDTMSPEDRSKFFEWYNAEKAKNETFNFQKEIEMYCKADVDILRLATLKFRDLFYNLLQIDPLTTSATIASSCMNAYLANFLPQDQIAYMSFPSYRMRDNQSKLALRYIRYFENKHGIELQSAYRGREKKFRGKAVDAFCPAFPAEKLGMENRIRPLILEIQGCYFHGCPTCYPNRAMRVGGKSKYPITIQSRYENTQKKMEFLNNLPGNPIVIEKWECEIYAECTTNPELKKAMTDARVITPIRSNREAFFGGRTENFYRYYKANRKLKEKIRYLDVNSLYPFVNKYGTYPIGHPQILLGDDIPKDLKDIVGIAKVRIIPPKKLYLPVLPVKANGKLTFALCQTCVMTENPHTCTHNDDEREIIGTYTCLELRKALAKGYLIKEITEVWSYEGTTYDKVGKQGGIFAGYIDKFLKIKQEASGFPADVVTDEQKMAFVKTLEDREGITLDLDKIAPNPGLRSLSKLCLNSLWGKFGQSNNMGQTNLIEKESQLYEFLTDPGRDITSITFLKGKAPVPEQPSRDIAYIQSKMIEEECMDSKFTNPVICAHVTAEARLELYRYMEALGDRLLYCDTDSIIYIERPGDPPIRTGPYLGQMGDEMDAYGKGAYILEFVSGGPKNYSLKIMTGSGEIVYITKIRGITLNFQNRALLNFETMKAFVLADTPENPPTPIRVVDVNKITRKRHHNVVNVDSVKEYKSVVSKRRRLDNYRTVPYGFVDDIVNSS